MPKIVLALGLAIGFGAAVVVYLAFLAHELLKASHSNVALGVGALLYVATRPMFLITAAVAFAVAFYGVAR